MAAIAVVVVTLVSPAIAWGYHGTCDPTLYPPPDAQKADEVLRLVNEHRVSLGLVPLQRSQSLERAAIWKARNMAATGYFAHNDDDGRAWNRRIEDCGYPAREGKGENIAVGYTTARSVVDGWLSSPGHRANMERPEWRGTGIGVSFGQGRYWWAQTFGTVVESHPRFRLRWLRTRLCWRHTLKGGAPGRTSFCKRRNTKGAHETKAQGPLLRADVRPQGRHHHRTMLSVWTAALSREVA